MLKRICFLGFACLSSFALPSCDLQVVRIDSCDQSGNNHFPLLGDPSYGLKVTWKDVGTAAANYTIRFQIGDQIYDWVNMSQRATGTYTDYRMMPTPLDGKIPVSTAIDIGNTTGDVNKTNNSMSGFITPGSISGTLEYYNFNFLNGTQRLFLQKVGTGTFSKLIAVMGRPTNETSQSTVTADGISGGLQLLSAPFKDPVHYIRYLNPVFTSGDIRQSFRVRASSVRMDSAKITQPWVLYSSFNTDIKPYSLPEARIQSSDAALGAFVGRYLPFGYRSNTLPIQAARILFRAVAKEMKGSNKSFLRATDALNAGEGDQMALSMVYVAALRNIGIPARVVSGFSMGTNQWAAWSEMWVPNLGWVPQDVSVCETYSPTSNLAYGFATVPDLNARVAVSRATAHIVDGITFGPDWRGEQYYYRTTGSGYFFATSQCLLTP